MKLDSKDFKTKSKLMWDIMITGKRIDIPIDFLHLDRLNIGRLKTKLIKKLLPSKNVTYFIDGSNVYIQESKGGDDWQQNFMAFTVKVKILDEYIKVHAGFYLTAMTVLYDLKKTKKLNNSLIFYAYSHGAGASPLLALRIKDEGFKIPEVINFESPRCIFRPSKMIKSLCSSFVNFKQGTDIVTSVPWWMAHLGYTVKVKGQKFPWYKCVLKGAFDHDIYWTKE